MLFVLYGLHLGLHGKKYKISKLSHKIKKTTHFKGILIPNIRFQSFFAYMELFPCYPIINFRIKLKININPASAVPLLLPNSESPDDDSQHEAENVAHFHCTIMFQSYTFCDNCENSFKLVARVHGQRQAA